MEKKNFNYSLKNIPVPNKQGYLKSMLDKVEHFLKRMRWKAYFYEKGNSKITDNGHFGFKSENTPPHALTTNIYIKLQKILTKNY